MAKLSRLDRVNREELTNRFREGMGPLGIAEFCVLVGISISTFYVLQRNGQAPRQINISTGGKRRTIRITSEAAREWMEAREIIPSLK